MFPIRTDTWRRIGRIRDLQGRNEEQSGSRCEAGCLHDYGCFDQGGGGGGAVEPYSIPFS